MSSGTKILSLVGLLLVCPIVNAQEIDFQPICKIYAGRPLAMQGTSVVVRSCDELEKITMQFVLKETTFSKIRESFKKQAGLNIRNAKEGEFPEFMQCKIFKSAVNPEIACNMTIFESKATMVYSGGPSGFIDKLSVTINDARGLIKPMIDGMDEKRGTRALPLIYELFLDILVAKNNAIATNEETYRRTSGGISVSILNAYPR